MYYLYMYICIISTNKHRVPFGHDWPKHLRGQTAHEVDNTCPPINYYMLSATESAVIRVSCLRGMWLAFSQSGADWPLTACLLAGLVDFSRKKCFPLQGPTPQSIALKNGWKSTSKLCQGQLALWNISIRLYSSTPIVFIYILLV